MICLGMHCTYLDMPSERVCERERARVEQEDNRDITGLVCLDRRPSEERH